MTMPFYADPDEPDRTTLAERTLHLHSDSAADNVLIYTARLSARSGPQGLLDLRVDCSLKQGDQEMQAFAQRAQGRDLIEQFCHAAALLHSYAAMMSAVGRLHTPDGEPFELDHNIFSIAVVFRDELGRSEPPDSRWAQ